MTAAIFSASEVEDALVAACKARPLLGIEERAHLTQAVCFWHRLDQPARARLLGKLAPYLPIRH